jgi:hypothetical protein
MTWLVAVAMVLLTVLVANPAAPQAPGRWTSAAAMPEERTEVAVAKLGGRVYVVGGFGGSGALLEYDPRNDRWQKRARLPAALHHTGAVAVGGMLYVVGGYDEGWSPVDTVFAYDPTSDRWRSGLDYRRRGARLRSRPSTGRSMPSVALASAVATRERTSSTILPQTGG